MPRLKQTEKYKDADTSTLLKKARQVVNAELDRSAIFRSNDLDDLPRFDASEIVLGKVVGRGGFGVVRELTGVKLRSDLSNLSNNSVRSTIEKDNVNAAMKRGNKKDSEAVLNDNSGHDSNKSGGSGKAGARNSNRQTNGTGRWGSFLSRGGSRGGGGSGSFHSASYGATNVPDAREHFARQVWSQKRRKLYVVKQVDPELIHSEKVTFLKGTIDLALETHYLASLSHPHILDIKGICCKSPFETTDYFIILDQLQEILARRLVQWMHQKRAITGITGVLTGGRGKSKQLLVERLLVAYDVADALKYLHARTIIFRDLKPDNIGFDGEGTVKLFDFGLAKELREEERTEDGLYHMTGLTGAIRYMAPEVGLRQPYNLKADVYSWSMLMWYIMALEPPLGLYTPNMFIQNVFQLGNRPALKDSWPAKLKDLMTCCWSEHIQERPDFTCIMDVLREQVCAVDPQTTAFLEGEMPSGSTLPIPHHAGIQSKDARVCRGETNSSIELVLNE